MTPLCSVYGLSSSEDDVVRYIGQTTKPLDRRLTQHSMAANSKQTQRSTLYAWIRKASRNGHIITIRLLEAECPWDEAERRWIADYRERYPGTLINLSDGGCGFSGSRSEATKAKMRKPKSEAAKAAMSKPKSASHKANFSLSLVGNIRSRGESNRSAVLTESDVITIKRRLSEGEGGSAIAREYGVQKSAISKIKVGRSWTHLAH